MQLTRRRFLHQSAVAAVAFPFVARSTVLGANSRLNIAGVGVGGKGWVDINGCDTENLVGLCDVDSSRVAAAQKKFTKARGFADWREMFDQLGKEIDAVTVSTPDHTHFPAAHAALQLRKHVYCQKPLTHTVDEARRLAAAARQAKVATQMGNQHFSHHSLRRDAELIRGGAVGTVREVHLWTDRPGRWWQQGLQRPAPAPAPSTLNWDLWLGVAPKRPYAPGYHPFAWRGFWDFGTGALGDMGCHLYNLPALALDLIHPVSVAAESAGATQESPPVWSVVTWEFAARGTRGPVKCVWYDGGKRPDSSLFGGKLTADNGVLVVGSKDTMLSNYDGGGVFLSGARREDFKSIPELYPKDPDVERAHYTEWISACKGGPRTLDHFDVAGPVTEAVLLGNVAIRTGRKLRWNAPTGKTDDAAANALLAKSYPAGFRI